MANEVARFEAGRSTVIRVLAASAGMTNAARAASVNMMFFIAVLFLRSIFRK
jgi:hypothetical protein